MGVRGGEARWGKGWGERQECCAGGNSAVLQTPVRYVEDGAGSIFFTRPCSGLNSCFTQPLNITTLFAIFLARLTHSHLPQARRPLTQLSSLYPLNHPPLFKCLPSTPFLSPLSICLSSSPFSPPLLPSTDHIPWVLCATARLMRGRLSLPVLWSYESWYPEQSCRSRHRAPRHLNDKALCKTLDQEI